ncbi:OmpA family protein [Limobrevibacterium gyesilva]|uniref:OmpA family protein n=1 Tax=Limobrevibacterium gyesilva TaxID=2991712 RepID=A0AA41YP21_9PROT|nr:OmpA family protein [Limobrevibacterium gyesilva]MCW3473890.1 OmpA family protein [Limobrevibacterium gyesilva]
MRWSFFVAAAATLLCFGSPSYAQQGPSADQIIKSLKPSGPLSSGTRGIRPVSPGAPAAPAPDANTQPAAAGAPAQAKPAAQAMQAKPPSVNLTVQFRTGSSELTPQAMHTLDELGRALTSPALAAYRFRIEGHTDTVGTPELNKTLSDARAAAVAQYLESRFGVGAARLETVGMGDTALLVATPPQTPEPRNRRVQVINIGT